MPYGTKVATTEIGIAAPMIGLLRMMSHALMTFCRSLANTPKNSLMFSGSRARSIPSFAKLSSNCIVLLFATRQSECPITVTSRAPFTAHASDNDRIVLLVGPVMMLPALRSQMNLSSGTPSRSGMSLLSRASMHVSAASGSESA